MALGRIRIWLAKPFVFFTLILLVKVCVARIVLFDGEEWWQPLTAELPAAWVLFCLIELLAPRRKLGLYVAVSLLLTCVLFAVIMYYKYFGVIVTYHALNQVGQVTEVKGSVFSLLHPYFLLIYADIVAFAALIWFSRRFRAWVRERAVRESRVLVTSLLVLALGVSTLNIRIHGGSINELEQAKAMGVLNYEFHEIAGGLTERNAKVLPVNAAAVERLKAVQSPADPVGWGAVAGRNVVILQLEATQNFLLDRKIDGQEIMPVLNGLMREHVYFPRFYQQVGQGNTSDAEFVVNTSFYIPLDGAASQVYADRALPSLPRTLKEHGYRTATFHTNDVQFWNREQLYKALGFDRYYDAAFFGDEDMVFFGPSDEVLYERTGDELLRMSETGKPFYAQIISMSSHHPFDIPERKVRLKLPERFDDTLVGHYIQAQNYTDYALGLFFDKLKRDGLWEQTIFIIYGDHLGLPIYSLSRKEKALMEEIYGREYGYAEMLNIPLLIVAPGYTQPTRVTQTGAQSDIFPTLANLLGISLADHVHFGRDLLNQPDNLIPQRYYLPSGSFINGNGIFVPGYDFAEGTTYGFDGADPGEGAATEDEYNRALELLEMSDNYVSHLPEQK